MLRAPSSNPNTVISVQFIKGLFTLNNLSPIFKVACDLNNFIFKVTCDLNVSFFSGVSFGVSFYCVILAIAP